MRISLPKNYKYKDIAVVENDVLYILREASFKALMYDLTCNIKNPNKCYYCQAKIHKGSSQTKKGDSTNFKTMDHLCPRNLGGPTIPENLAPCCSTCNCKKDNMTEQDFRIYKSLADFEKLQFRKDLEFKYDFILKHYSPLVPEEWLSYISPDKINVTTRYPSDREARKVELMYNKCGRIYAAIIVDKNYSLLDGFGILSFAKSHKIENVPVIILENVEIRYSQ